MDITDKRSTDFSRRLLESNPKSTVVLGQVLTLLEHFKFQRDKFKFLNYCDFRTAFFCFKSSRLILKCMKEADGKSLDALFKSMESTIEALNPDFLEMERYHARVVVAPQSDLQTRLNKLKFNEDTISRDELSNQSLKFRDLISAQELNSILRMSPGRVLLIDFRSRKEFQYSHINYLEVVNIEPQMLKNLLSENFSASDQSLESALSGTIDASMMRKFNNRHKYDLIVFYNLRYGLSECSGINALEHSLSVGDTSSYLTSNPFVTVIKLITFKTKYLSSRVKQYPLILNGGLENWYQTIGEAGLSHISREDTNVNESKSDALNNEFGELRYLKKFGDYFSSGLILNPVVQPDSKFEVSDQPVMKNNFSVTRSHLPEPIEGDKIVSNRKGEKTCHPVPSKLAVISFTTGLTNLGNSCYMNCVLQCLAATSPLIDFFMKNVKQGREDDKQQYKQHINFRNALGTKGVVTSAFAGLLTDMNERNGAVFSPTNFKRVIGAISPCKQFATSDQQDCIEFLNYILDSLHEDLNQRLVENEKERAMIMDLSSEQESAREILPVRLASTIEWERYLKLNFSIVVDYFQGQYLSQLKCLECSLTSTTFNAFSILSLPIPEKLNGAKTVLLSECLQLFLDTELLDENNKWHCPRCKMFTQLTKKITITRLPQVLIIHFKRFKLHAGYFKKLETFVTYPVDKTLDMTKYWPPVGSYMNSLNINVMDKATEQKYLASFPPRNQVPPFEYKLYGVANHFGNLTTGHYTSFVQKNDRNSDPDWCYFDDARVQHGVSPKDVLNSNAYCLFYRRV